MNAPTTARVERELCILNIARACLVGAKVRNRELSRCGTRYARFRVAAAYQTGHGWDKWDFPCSYLVGHSGPIRPNTVDRAICQPLSRLRGP